MDIENLIVMSDACESDLQPNTIEEDFGNDRNAVRDDSLSEFRDLRKSFSRVLKQISAGHEFNRLRKRQLEHYYNMNHKNRGLALIFNHERFDNDMKHRSGTQADRERLCETFRALDFDVRIYDDLKQSEILDQLEKVAEMDHSDNDCLVVVILTHGKIKDFNDDNSCNTLLNHDLMGYVHSKNGKYPLQDAWYYFTNESCPTLANKPRIFLIQACQGEKRENAFKLATIQVHKVKAPKQKSERTANFSFLPKQDFLVAYSSLPGHVSFRDAKQGSWFIQSFCDEMERRKPDDDLLTTLTLATQKVAHEFESNPGLKGNKQIPCIFSRLTKLIVFTKKPRAESHPMGWVQPIGWVY